MPNIIDPLKEDIKNNTTEKSQSVPNTNNISSNQFDEYIAEGKQFVDKDNEKALQMFQKALLEANNDPNKITQAKLWVAKMQLQLKNYIEAESIFREVLKNKPSDIDEAAALAGIIRAKNYSGNPGIAIEMLPLKYPFKTPDLVVALAEAYMNLGKKGQVSFLLKSQKGLLKDVPEDSYLSREISLLNKFSANDDKNQEIEPNNTNTQFDEYVTEGKQYIDKDNEKALQMFQKALLAANNDPNKVIQAKLWMAKMHLQLKNYNDAENLFREVLKNKPNDIDEEAALAGIIRVKNYGGNPEIAIEIIPLNYPFKTPDLVVALAEAYVELGKEMHATFFLDKQRKLLSTIPKDSFLKKQVDALYEKISKKNHNENVKTYNEYIKAAHYAEYLNDYKSALELFEKAFKTFEYEKKLNIQARLGIAKMNYALGKYDIAKKLYSELLNENLEKTEREIALEGLKLSKNPSKSQPSSQKEENKTTNDIFSQCIDPIILAKVEEYISQKNYKDAIILLDKEANRVCCNPYLWLKEASIYQDIEQYKKVLQTLDFVDRRFPCSLESINLRKKAKEKLCMLPHNQFDVYYDREYVSDIQQYWYFRTYSYHRIENYLRYGFAYNSAARLGFKGNQTEINATVDILRGLRADLSFAHASKSQVLYPNYQYYGEAYYSFLTGFEVSLGQENRRYVTFHNQKVIRTTASLGKYWDKYYLWGRINKFNFQHTLLGEIGLAKYFNDNDYLSVKIIMGKGPDIANLPPLDQMVLLIQRGYGFSGQVELVPKLFVKIGMGFYSLYYPFNNLHRRITDSYINVAWRF